MRGRISDLDCADSEDMRHSSCVQTICLSSKKIYAEIYLDRGFDKIELKIRRISDEEETCDYDTDNVLEDIIEVLNNWLKEIAEQ